MVNSLHFSLFRIYTIKVNLIEKSIKPNLALIFNPCNIKVFIQPLYKETKSWKTKNTKSPLTNA